MMPQDVSRYFTRADGKYLFARWGRPIVPVVFGVAETTVAVFKGAVEAACLTVNHKMAETDPELGANLMVFFCQSWSELAETPNLEMLVPDLADLVFRLEQAQANQYRLFRFDPDGGIRAAFVFLQYDAHLAAVSAETLALSQIIQTLVLWSDKAFQDQAPLMSVAGSEPILRPEIAALLRAAYDPAMPVAAQDASHALRLQARMSLELPQ